MRRRNIVSVIGITVVAVGALVLAIGLGYAPKLGLDLQGGASVTLLPEGKVSADSLSQAVQIIRQRVDALGVAEPEITRQGDAIVVNLPGVKDQDRALQLVGQTAELRFRPVLQLLGPDASQPVPVPATTAPPAAGPTAATTAAPTDTTVAPTATAPGTTAAGGGPGDARVIPAQDSPTTAPPATTAAPTDATTVAGAPTTTVPTTATTTLATTTPENDQVDQVVVLP